jgi:heme oxygenase
MRSDHAVLGRMVRQFDLAEREDYALFLSVHRSALRMLENHWRKEDQADFAAMLSAVAVDLYMLGLDNTHQHADIHAPLAPGGQLGMAYVVRGTRLVACTLRREVPDYFPTAYLDLVPTLSWNQFLLQLEQKPDAAGGTGHDQPIHGARTTCTLFKDLFARALAGDRSARNPPPI